MKNWFNKNYKTIIILSFLIPIITVAIVSITHVTKWYGISNPLTWALYLSIGIEIAALSALAAISANMGSKVYFPFGIVTLIQFIGNIYFAYSYIDINSQSFISWVELVSPLLEYMGVEPTDFIGHKRFLSFFSGGMLPIISLTFLHMLVKFTQVEKKTSSVEEPIENKVKEMTQTPIENKEEVPVVDVKDIVSEVSRIRLSEDDLSVLEKILNKLDKKSEPPIELPNKEDLKENSSEFHQSNDTQKIVENDNEDTTEEIISEVQTQEPEDEKSSTNTDSLIPTENITLTNQNTPIVNEVEKKN
jgi:hypothetical protein